MKICPKNEALEKKASDHCVVEEYPLGPAPMDLAIATLKGRYPDTGWALNLVSDEMAYILEGQGGLVTESGTQSLNAGDALLIERGEKYYWEGNMRILMSCSPPWTPDQHAWIGDM